MMQEGKDGRGASLELCLEDEKRTCVRDRGGISFESLVVSFFTSFTFLACFGAGETGCCSFVNFNFCLEGEGGCSDDRDCKGDLVCGTDNCPNNPTGRCCEGNNTTSY